MCNEIIERAAEVVNASCQRGRGGDVLQQSKEKIERRLAELDADEARALECGDFDIIESDRGEKEQLMRDLSIIEEALG